MKRKQISYSHIPAVILLTALMVLQGCDVHEFPKEDAPAPPKAQHTLTLTFDDDDFAHHQTVMIGTDRNTRGHAANPSYDLRYIVRAYRNETVPGLTSRVTSRSVIDFYDGTATDCGEHPDLTLPLDLEEGEYDLLAWCEHIPLGTGTDFYYDTSNFYELSLHGAGTQGYMHSGNDPFKEAWRGALHIHVARDGAVSLDGSQSTPTNVVMEMKRPMARFHFVTTDLEEFISRVHAKSAGTETETETETLTVAPQPDEYRVLIRYTGYMPSTYNLLTDKPIDSSAGVTFEGAIEPVDNTTAQLGFDYVLVNGSDTSVQVALELYRRSDGQLLSSTGVVDVPLKRGRYTVVKGPMLTTMAGAGLGINPGFNGDFNIEIH